MADKIVIATVLYEGTPVFDVAKGDLSGVLGTGLDSYESFVLHRDNNGRARNTITDISQKK